MFEHVNGGKRKNRRERLPAAGVSVVLHVLLIGALFFGVRAGVLTAGEPWGDGIVFGEPAGGGGGGGGAGGEELVSYVEISPPEPEPEVEPEPEEDVLVPPEPEPVVEPPRPQPASSTPAPSATPRAPPAGAGTGAGTGGGAGAGEGPGEGPGVGPGSGGGTGGGTGGGIGSGTGPGSGAGTSRIRPPQTDLLLVPPDRPGAVPSQDVTVVLRVDTRGRVRSARLSQSTGNRGYDERIRRWAMDLVFRPAVNLDTNQPVEVDYPIEIGV